MTECQHNSLEAINERIVDFNYEEDVRIETDLRCLECGKIVGTEKGKYKFEEI